MLDFIIDPKTSRCPFCGKLYEVFNMYVGDQSCCPSCRREVKKLGEKTCLLVWER